jgi:hypothetical protein
MDSIFKLKIKPKLRKLAHRFAEDHHQKKKKEKKIDMLKIYTDKSASREVFHFPTFNENFGQSLNVEQ